MDRLLVLSHVAPNALESLVDSHARRDRHVVGREQVPGARVGPFLDVADFLGGFGVDLRQRLEDLLARLVGQRAEEVRAIIGRHLARDDGDRLGPHLLDELLLSVLLEALENRCSVLRGPARQQRRRLVGFQFADDVGEVLGMNLVGERTQLVRILSKDLLNVRSEQAPESHVGAPGG